MLAFVGCFWFREIAFVGPYGGGPLDPYVLPPEAWLCTHSRPPQYHYYYSRVEEISARDRHVQKANLLLCYGFTPRISVVPKVDKSSWLLTRAGQWDEKFDIFWVWPSGHFCNLLVNKGWGRWATFLMRRPKLQIFRVRHSFFLLHTEVQNNNWCSVWAGRWLTISLIN